MKTGKMRQLLSVLLILCLLCIQQDAKAQTKRRYKRTGSKLDIRYGAKVGWQLSSFTGDEYLAEFDSDNLLIYPPVEYGSFSSFHGGVYLDIRLSDEFIFQPEIIYMQAGAEMTREADQDNPEQNFIVTTASNPLRIVEVPIERRLNLIQVPLVAKIPFTREIHFHIGPQIAFKMSETNVYGDIPDSLITQFGFTPEGAPDLFQGLDIGGIIGLSYQMDAGLNVTMRVNRNFRNINKNEGLGITAEPPLNNLSIFSLSIGYTLFYDQRLRYAVGRRY